MVREVPAATNAEPCVPDDEDTSYSEAIARRPEGGRELTSRYEMSVSPVVANDAPGDTLTYTLSR